jgi:hypothetical protein
MDHNTAIVAVFSVVAAAVPLSVVGNALLKRWSAPKESPGVRESLDAMQERFARVEVALDELTAELGRVSESNQFLTRLLADRSREPQQLQ